MAFELSQLRCFVAAAEELHFGRAAARLNMTQPPLSRQIQLLERAVGVTLLERTSRAVRVTPAGRAFLIEARRILKLSERCLEGLEDRRRHGWQPLYRLYGGVGVQLPAQADPVDALADARCGPGVEGDGERRTYRPGRPADGCHAGLDDRNRVAPIAVADGDIGEHELVELPDDSVVIARARRGRNAQPNPAES